jgi:hypothetical protein
MENTIAMEKYYLCNPDVVLREEDESGGLLFNPDTNQVKVVNLTGLFIWKQFSTENCPTDVAKAVLEAFEDAPKDQVADDLGEFLTELLQTGFIGIIESM